MYRTCPTPLDERARTFEQLVPLILNDLRSALVAGETSLAILFNPVPVVVTLKILNESTMYVLYWLSSRIVPTAGTPPLAIAIRLSSNAYTYPTQNVPLSDTQLVVLLDVSVRAPLRIS